MKAPRELTFTFTLHVPEGVRANIQGKHLNTAVDRVVGAVQAVVPMVFPWADRITVRTGWAYQWWDDTDTIALPATEKNTVTEPDDEETLNAGTNGQP
jgi:hypothetical protein